MNDVELNKKLARFEESINGFHEVVADVRDVLEEATLLRAKVHNLTTRLSAMTLRCAQAERILREMDGIIKNPGAGVVQQNYEDFLPPDLRLAHIRAVRAD